MAGKQHEPSRLRAILVGLATPSKSIR